MTIGQTRIAVTLLLLASTHLSTLSTGNASETLAEKITRLQQLEEHCNCVSEPPDSVSESCFHHLDDYFDSEPIWNTVRVNDYGVHGKMHSAVLNRRSLSLIYIDADFAGEVPLWQDVFDGRTRERLDIVQNVFSDETCQNLAIRGAIDSKYATRCQARELVKYASYLDACTTAIDRIPWLHMKGMDGLTRYHRARQRMDSSLTIEGKDPDEGWRSVENYLHALWLAKKCSSTAFDASDHISKSSASSSGASKSRRKTHPLRPVHDNAMAIAARAGDAWAIQSFDMTKINDDWDFWKSLRQINPSLYHRFTAEDSYWWADEKDRAMHALKAYSIDRQVSPSLDLDDYLSHYGITRNDFGVPEASVESLLESDGLDELLVDPWEVDREKVRERFWREWREKSEIGKN